MLGRDSQLKPFSILDSNQEEADTKMLFIASVLDYESCLICSTDTDILFVACMMAPKLCDRNIYIKYNVSGLSPAYICCKQLFSMMGNDMDPNLALANNQGKSIPRLFGIIHYISGCDYLSHLKGFSKKDCCDAVVKHMDFVFSRGIICSTCVRNS